MGSMPFPPKVSKLASSSQGRATCRLVKSAPVSVNTKAVPVKWRSATGVKMWGAKGKTDYSDPTNPVISPGGYWKY